MIYVTSYPKSGATWFQFLMYSCFRGKISSSIEVMQYYPEVFHTDSINARLKSNDILFIKNHFAFNKELPYYEKIQGCIYLVRNPLDVCFSRINHLEYEGVTIDSIDSLVERYNWLVDRADVPTSVSDKIGGWN